MAERGNSRLADKINGIRMPSKSRRTSAPEILIKGPPDTAATLRRAITTDPAADRKSKREQRTSSMVQRMDPNDIIKMLEMQAQNANSEIGLESLQALKRTTLETGGTKERRSSRKKIERSMSTDGSSPAGGTRKPRRSSKKKMIPRSKSLNPALEKSWAGLSVDDL